MSVEQHPEPITEGLLHSSQRLVQILALAAALQQGYARRAERLRAAADARETQAERAAALELKATFEHARARWAPAHDSTWLRNAELIHVAEAWGAAVPYAEDSASASSAVRKCEERLRDLHPHAMSHYDRLRGDGQDPLTAMKEAAPFFTRDPNVRTGEPATPHPELAEGTGAHWAAKAHGPDRREWEEALQENRAQAIATDLRERLRDGGRDPHPEELRTELLLTTNLPEHIISKVVTPAGGQTGTPPSTQVQLAAEDFPLPIGEAMEVTLTQQPTATPGKRMPHRSPDRHRQQRRSPGR
ncbi:hypothetical protein ACFQ07_33945 [Actinomadura adrarensis]|uniref:Uncharacterized protein n=1 Tax=Actinomadura adrarensis TaxID=1819600 RepID=A0ABW3CRR6_9ACTN